MLWKCSVMFFTNNVCLGSDIRSWFLSEAHLTTLNTRKDEIEFWLKLLALLFDLNSAPGLCCRRSAHCLFFFRHHTRHQTLLKRKRHEEKKTWERRQFCGEEWISVAQQARDWDVQVSRWMKGTFNSCCPAWFLACSLSSQHGALGWVLAPRAD